MLTKTTSTPLVDVFRRLRGYWSTPWLRIANFWMKNIYTQVLRINSLRHPQLYSHLCFSAQNCLRTSIGSKDFQLFKNYSFEVMQQQNQQPQQLKHVLNTMREKICLQLVLNQTRPV